MFERMKQIAELHLSSTGELGIMALQEEDKGYSGRTDECKLVNTLMDGRMDGWMAGRKNASARKNELERKHEHKVNVPTR